MNALLRHAAKLFQSPGVQLYGAHMRNSWSVAVVTAALFVLLVAVFSFHRTAAAGPPQRKAVVVELFTSEGCSSCPPADNLLGRLRALAQTGVDVIPLGFHVDYWDYLGWHDRFASAAFSRRQEMYASRFRLDGPYTPQMVVDGGQEFAGSDGRRAQEAIARAAARPEQADVQLQWKAPGRLAVRVKSVASGLNGEAILAITEDNLSTSVGAGENNGHVLHHSAVVREFRSLGKLKDGTLETEASIAPAKGWKLDDLRIVVFVQPASGEAVAGAASLQWISGPGNR